MSSLNFSQIIELVGYIGSALVIVSMLMTSVVKLRVINSIGCVVFGIYALFIKSYPTAGMQFFLLLINLVNLYRLLSSKNAYTSFETTADNEMLSFFVSKYSEDIKKFFPEFTGLDKSYSVFVICLKDTPVGIFAGTKTISDSGNKTETSINAVLDYTTPAYRDCSVGKYVFKMLKEKGFTSVSSVSSCEAHSSYLKKMGFAQAAGAQNSYRKEL